MLALMTHVTYRIILLIDTTLNPVLNPYVCIHNNNTYVHILTVNYIICTAKSYTTHAQIGSKHVHHFFVHVIVLFIS